MVMGTEKSRRRLPPYISYRTLRNFLEELQKGIPARIDRSYWGERLSGSTGTQLMAALRFLGLIDTNSMPTMRLKSLVYAKGNQRIDLLTQITTESFSFLSDSVDPQTATYAQLEEAFHHTFQLTGDVSRKCVKFYVAIATESGVSLSSFITKRIRLARSNTSTKTNTKRKNAGIIPNIKIPQDSDVLPDSTPWDKLLLTKFPVFDPTWTDEIKLNWFKAFDELLRMGSAQNGK
tara:strand:+ start:118 stop:819 length:702 start_codon:yes stop_codon:yes gene_type:complete